MENNLYRSRYGAIGGVCTGIANYMNVEPIIIQVLFIILYWSPVPIILAYLILWLFLKKQPI
jgi:phage shock protein PspC (stress-responsive transcriptional regulator)